MSTQSLTPPQPLVRLQVRRQELQAIRQAARQQLSPQATGSQIAGNVAAGFETLVVSLLNDAAGELPDHNRQRLMQGTAVLAIGGFGRSEMAPYSDVDLLFLYDPVVEENFTLLAAQVVRDSWDTGLKLGHSVRTFRDALAAIRSDLHFATAVTSGRCLWGSPIIAEDFLRRFRRLIAARRRDNFVKDCIAARLEERATAGGAVLQLEPDLKRSYGGLRDLQLLHWIHFAEHGPGNLESLRLQGDLTQDEALQLTIAHDFLLNLRIDLHLHAGKAHDVLTRDHQLRIAAERQISGTAGQLPVEKFMQMYFQHSLAVAEIADQFVARHRNHSRFGSLGRFLLTVRIDEIYTVGAGELDVRRRSRSIATETLEGALKIYLTAARYRVLPTYRLEQQIKSRSAEYSSAISRQACELFLEMLACPGQLGRLLRSLYSCGVLELVLPAWSHVRCLLQFNQYHSFTVDEHTLRTIETVEKFDSDLGPVGQAYRELKHKEILHLALLLHDAGKGFPEDHSEVGRRLALEAAARLKLSDAARDLLVFLVHRHLLMADLAFRRDSSDPQVLLQFSHEVGSPENLKHLYVLTVADITAVGPGVWTEWKAELLTTLYDRAMQWLSGQSHEWDLSARRNSLREEVLALLPTQKNQNVLCQQWDHLPDHYLLATPAKRIADDLQIVFQRSPDDIHVEGRYEPETGTVVYRVITHENLVQGCFHKLTGVMTVNRLEILTASICTTLTGAIIDAYQVRDGDFSGEVPSFRIEEVCGAIRRILAGQMPLDHLLSNRRRIGHQRYDGPVSNLPLRVVIDQDSSERSTIIEVFAHDQPGLLFLVSRTLFDLELSVIRAQISTHFDQVVDGFYVTDRDGSKIDDEHRLRTIHDRLVSEIQQLEPA